MNESPFSLDYNEEEESAISKGRVGFGGYYDKFDLRMFFAWLPRIRGFSCMESTDTDP